MASIGDKLSKIGTTSFHSKLEYTEEKNGKLQGSPTHLSSIPVMNSNDKAVSVNVPTWLTVLFKTLNEDTMEAACTVILGTSDQRIPHRVRVNESPIEMNLRRASHRLTFDVKIPFIKRDVFSTFPNVVEEYSTLIELTSEGDETHILRPILSVPNNGNVADFVDFHDKFMDPFVKGSMLISLEEEKSHSDTYLPRLRVRVLKIQPALIHAVRFYTPICGMWFGLILSYYSFKERDNFYNAVLAIVMTLTIAYRDIVRENDTGELLLFNCTLIMFFSCMIDHPYQEVVLFAPLLSLGFLAVSRILLNRWLRVMCTKHDLIIQGARLPKEEKKRLGKDATKSSLKDLRKEFEEYNMIVKEPYVIDIKGDEWSDLFPTSI